MKTKITLIPVLLIGLLLANGCYSDGEGLFGIRGQGSSYDEERVVGSFSSIDIAISGQVFLTQSATEEVTIEAQQNILDNIETYVVGDKLKIRFRRNVIWHDGIKIYISNPNYEGIEISGSADLVNDTPIKTDYLDLNISGSGSMNLEDVEVDYDLKQSISGSGQIILSKLKVYDDAESNISGSGKITMSGSSTIDYHTVQISGSGNVNSDDIWVDWLDVRISGSGNCRCAVVSKLDATITGSGSVFYDGNPQVNAHITGSGKVQHL